MGEETADAGGFRLLGKPPQITETLQEASKLIDELAQLQQDLTKCRQEYPV